MRTFTRVLLAACLLCGVAPARAAGVNGAVGILLYRPLSSDLADVYPLGVGLAVDLGLVYTPHWNLSVQVSPALAWGEPSHGSLAAEPAAKMLTVPAHVVVQYSWPVGGMRPYAGAGAGLLYAREELSFQGPLGAANRSHASTCFSWTLMAGLETGTRSTRPFLEVHWQHAGTGSIEDQAESGVSLATLQLRAGVRTRLK